MKKLNLLENLEIFYLLAFIAVFNILDKNNEEFWLYILIVCVIFLTCSIISDIRAFCIKRGYKLRRTTRKE